MTVMFYVQIYKKNFTHLLYFLLDNFGVFPALKIVKYFLVSGNAEIT